MQEDDWYIASLIPAESDERIVEIYFQNAQVAELHRSASGEVFVSVYGHAGGESWDFSLADFMTNLASARDQLENPSTYFRDILEQAPESPDPYTLGSCRRSRGALASAASARLSLSRAGVLMTAPG
jgi:hypothetical protein